MGGFTFSRADLFTRGPWPPYGGIQGRPRRVVPTAVRPYPSQMNRFTTWTLSLLLVWQAARQFHASLGWGHDSWQLTEWLINYGGGFVRRGLPGSLLAACSGMTGIQANHLVIGISFALYGLLLALLLRRTRGHFAPVFVLSCVAMGFPAYQDCIVRKDCALLLLFLGCVRLIESKRPVLPTAGLLNLTCCLALLCHETFAFIAFPTLLWFARARDGGWCGLPLWRRTLLLAPSLACMAAVVLRHGDPATADAVNRSWIPLWLRITPGAAGIDQPAAAIEAIGWTTEKGLSLGLTLLTSGFYQPMAWATVFAISFILTLSFACGGRARTTRDREGTERLTGILLVQLLALGPLFLLGYDYGRWLFDWVISSMILHSGGFRVPDPAARVIGMACGRIPLHSITGIVRPRCWVLLLFGVPVCWNLAAFLQAGPVGRTASFLLQRF